VSEGISPQLLQWKGIEATEKIAESTNAKIIIMGNTQSSLPVLLSSMTAEGSSSSSSSNLRGSQEGFKKKVYGKYGTDSEGNYGKMEE
jgi:hypothetical protein